MFVLQENVRLFFGLINRFGCLWVMLAEAVFKESSIHEIHCLYTILRAIIFGMYWQ